MRLDLAVIALTLFTGSSASVIGVRNGVDFSAVDEHDLFKRRGGGGGGSRGGGGSSSSGSSGSRGGSSGSSSSGSSSSGSSSSGSSGSSSSGSRGGSSSYGSSSYGSSYGSSSGSSSSNRGSGPGGTFRAPPGPALSGGRYPGGAVRPVNAGSRLAGGLAPLALGAGVGLAIVATAWAFSAWHNPYLYQYNNPYYYHDPRTNKNESMPIVCVCEDNHPCGCDDLGNNQNYGYMTQIIGNSSLNTVNNSQVAVGRNSNKGNETTLFVNGTLDGDEDSGAAHSIAVAGFWPVAATVFAIVFVL